MTEQGKLAYVISAYMATVLLNVAAIFAVAPVIKHEVENPACYRFLLVRGQAILAILSTLVIITSMYFYGASIGWELSPSETGILALFFFLQQLADFKRRAAYIFDSVWGACKISFWTYGLRIVFLLVLRPDTIFEFLAIFVVGALIGSLSTIFSHFRFIGNTLCAQIEQSSTIALHMRRSLWTTLNAPLSWICFFLPIFILGATESAKAAAILVSIRSISSVANVALELLETMIPNWLAARAANHGTTGLRSSTNQILLTGTVFWAIGLLIIFAINDKLIYWLLGHEYAAYSSLLIVAWIGNGVHFVSRVIGLHYRTHKKTHVELIGSLGGLAALAGSVFLISSLGIVGAAWTYVVVPAGMIMAQMIILKNRE